MADRVEAPPAGSKNADSAPTSARVRNRLSRIGGKSGSPDPVLDPLLKVYRNTHPKGDVASIQKAYDIAERMHEDSRAKVATPTSPTRLPSPRSSLSSV